MSLKHEGRSSGARALGVAGMVMVLLLAGCGSSGGSSEGEGTTTTEDAATTTEATTTIADETTTTAVATTTTPPDSGTPILSSTEIGPLRIDQSLDEAQATGWVGTDIGTCELAGDPPPGTFGFRLDGASAPADLDGSISVVDNKIAVINIRGGARMANDVTIEPFGTWTSDQAIADLTAAEYDITYETLLEENDLAVVTSPDGNDYELSLTEVGVSVAVPNIEVCE